MRFRKHFLALGFWKSGHGFARIFTDQNFEKENPRSKSVFIRENLWPILFCRLLRLGDNAQIWLG